MGGLEIERMLKRIDANVDANSRLLRDEVLRYIGSHQDDVMDELRSCGMVSIPTSTGVVRIPMSALEEVVA